MKNIYFNLIFGRCLLFSDSHSAPLQNSKNPQVNYN